MNLNEALEEFGITPRELQARGLAAFSEPEQLVVAEVGEDGRQHRLTPAASAAWKAMKDAAGHDGLVIVVQSAFRSVERQARIIRARLERGEQIESILSVSAPPGFSEHHTGRAVDVVTPECPRLERRFEETAAFRWLQEHAGRFGFRLSYPRGNAQGYQYEPWHWCYKAAAG